MTILHLRSAEFFGSPERLIIGQCRHLDDFDFVCASFVRGHKDNRFLQECEKNGLAIGKISESFTGDFRVVGRIRQLIRDRGIDLLVSHDYKSNLFGYLATRKERIPQVAYFHGVTSEDAKVKLYNLIDRFILPRMKKVIAVSSLTGRFLTGRGLLSEKVQIVPNAVDPVTLLKQRPSRPDGTGPARVIAVGRFSYEKGFDLLLEAVAKIRVEAPPYELWMYGFGPEEAKLRDLVTKLGLTDTVKFCGFVDDILPIFREVDFMVMSSRSEGMPVVILEAWSQQLGVLATSVGGIPEMIESGRNGLLVKPENVTDLADKLLWALSHRDELARFGREGYEVVRKKYTFSIQAKQLRSIYSGQAGGEQSS